MPSLYTPIPAGRHRIQQAMKTRRSSAALTLFKFVMASYDHMQVEDLPEAWARACLT
jgi:hypothetical protein